MAEANETKHTPGPWSPMWQNSRELQYGGGIRHWEIPVAVGEWPKGGNSICTVHMGGPGATISNKEAVEANARLIASAPDLLACALAQEELATNSFDGDPQEAIIRVRNMRRAAISKATS